MSQSKEMSCTIWSRSTIELVQTLQVKENFQKTFSLFVCFVFFRRKKKCLRYTENESVSMDRQSFSEENSTDPIEDSNDDDEERPNHDQINFQQHTLEFV